MIYLSIEGLILIFQASGKSEQFLKPSNTVSKVLSNSNYKITTNTNITKLKPKVVTVVPLAKVNSNLYLKHKEVIKIHSVY
jgi:hypothetical protein